MVVRGMAASPKFLVLNMVTPTGDAWLGIQGAADQTLMEFQPGELVSSSVVLRSGQVLVALRRKPALYRADLGAREKLPLLPVEPVHGDEDRVGGLRTWMRCNAD
jgi:hypothetical protein